MITSKLQYHLQATVAIKLQHKVCFVEQLREVRGGTSEELLAVQMLPSYNSSSSAIH
jgi:hypothetical protein